MTAPAIENKTKFQAEPLFLFDENGRPILTMVVKATFRIMPGYGLLLSDKQAPVDFEGKFWGDPETSGYKYEPETAFFKPATDIALVGRVHPPNSKTTRMAVGLKVGPIRKAVKVFGDRYWLKSLGKPMATEPKPIEKISLSFECAYGGWDRSHPDPARHVFDDRNPVGTGFCVYKERGGDGLKLPNLEHPEYPIKNIEDRPPPAAFGFVSPHWRPRASLAGTYGEKWMKEKMPLLPDDFDRRFFNAAPADQIAPGRLKGDEPVVVVNASPGGKLSFHLPGIEPPRCLFQIRGEQDRHVASVLDTVVINTDENLLFLIWRANTILSDSHEDAIGAKTYSDAAFPDAGSLLRTV